MAILLPTQPGLFAGASTLAMGFEAGAFAGASGSMGLELLGAGISASEMADSPLSAMIGAYREAVSLGNTSAAETLGQTIAGQIREDRDALNRVLAQIPQGLMGGARFQSSAQNLAPPAPPIQMNAVESFAEPASFAEARSAIPSSISARRTDPDTGAVNIANNSSTRRVAKILDDAKLRRLDPSLNPEIGRFQAGLASFLETLLIPEDTDGGKQKIQAVLIDSMQIGAFYTKVSDTEKVISITLGLLKFVENDDELAFVLAHELSHGHSELEAHAISSASQKPGAWSRIYARGLQRAVENEVDVKATVLRLHQKGRNPHAARHFLGRLIDTLGEGAGPSHTMTSSRKDAVDMALTYLHRNLGETVREDAPSEYSSALTGPLKKRFLDLPSFREMQLARLRKMMNISENPATEVYRNARAGKTVNVAYESPYESIYSKYRSEIVRLTDGILTVEEDIDLQLALHECLDQLFEEARRREIGDSFVVETPEQLYALLQADKREYYVRPDDIVAARNKILRLRHELANIPHAATIENESLGRATRLKLVRAEREYAQIKHAYVADLKFDALADEVARESKNNYAGMDNRRYLKLKSQLDAKQRLIPPLNERNKERSNRLIEAAAEVIIGDIGRPEAFHADQRPKDNRLGMFFALPEKVVRANLERAFKAYMGAAMAYIDDGSASPDKSSKIRDVFDRYANNNSTPVQKLLIDYMQSSPVSAVRDFREMYNFMISKAPDIKTLEFLYGGTKNLSFATLIEGWPQVAFSPAFARAILDEETLSNYFGRYSALLMKQIRFSLYASASEAVGAYTQRIRSTIESGIGAQYLPTIFRDTCEQLILALSKKLWMPLLLRGIVLPSKAARSVLLASQPGLLDLALQSGSVALTDFERDLRLFGDIVAKKGKTLHIIPFFALANIIVKPPQIMDPWSFPSHLFEKRSAENRSEEDFFRFMTDVSDLVHHGASAGVTGKLTGDFTAATALRYAAWLKKRHPERVDLMASALNPNNILGTEDSNLTSRFNKASVDFLKERFDYYVERHSVLPTEKRIEEAAYHLWKEMKPWGLVWVTSNYGDRIGRSMPLNPQERLDFFNGYMRGVRRVEAEDKPQIIELQGGAKIDLQKNRYDTKWFANFFTTEDLLGQASLEALSRAFLLVLRDDLPESSKDLIFEHIWKRSRGREDIRKMFLDEEIVGRLYYDENKMNLARWQLNARHGIDSIAAGIREGHTLPPREGHIRAEVREAMQTINGQFLKKSAAKNEMIAYVEDSFLTNDSETKYLSEKRLGLSNWYESRLLAALDAPTAASHAIKSNYHRLELVRYLIDATHEVPRFVREYSQKLGVEALPVAKRFFMEADVHTRNYILQSLLDEKYGILEEDGVYREMVRLILGEHADNDIVEAIFKSYLESAPPFERKVILGHILASFVDGGRRGASIGSVLESMGPFGVKAAQFLRTSGLIDCKLAAELDRFLDRAMPPIRPEIFAELKKVFGDNLAHIHHVMELAGSGSISYAVVADMQNPATRKITRVVIRVLRETTEGRAGNENQIWKLAISKIMSSGNPRHRRIARILDEVRRQTYETLKPGGIELNYEIEREASHDAAATYSQPANGPAGFSIEAIQPIEALQRLVPGNFSKRISIYPYVPNTRLSAIPSENLRAELSGRIVEAEFKALFENGVFDPDGTPGNWLIDLSGKRLVRIDYAQLRRIEKPQSEALQRVLTTLIMSAENAEKARSLARDFGAIFDADGSLLSGLSDVILKIMNEKEYPDSMQPHEMIFFIRERIEAIYEERGMARPVQIRDSIRSALALIAKTQIYREHMDDASYFQILLKYLMPEFP